MVPVLMVPQLPLRIVYFLLTPTHHLRPAKSLSLTRKSYIWVNLLAFRQLTYMPWLLNYLCIAVCAFVNLDRHMGTE